VVFISNESTTVNELLRNFEDKYRWIGKEAWNLGVMKCRCGRIIGGWFFHWDFYEVMSKYLSPSECSRLIISDFYAGCICGRHHRMGYNWVNKIGEKKVHDVSVQ